MPLVEVVGRAGTASDVVERAVALMEAWGKVPIRCTDTPGFIVNRVNRPYTIEALRMLEAGDAGVEAIDDAMRAIGYPMGPFELIDLIGVDVNLAVATAIWEGLGRPRPAPAVPGPGRAGGGGPARTQDRPGFYRYEDGGRTGVDEAFGTAPEARTRTRRRSATASNERSTAKPYWQLDEGVATEADIDRAMRLGAGHPRGPFEREAGS